MNKSTGESVRTRCSGGKPARRGFRQTCGQETWSGLEPPRLVQGLVQGMASVCQGCTCREDPTVGRGHCQPCPRPREISQDPHTPSDLSRPRPGPCRTTRCCPVSEWEEEDGLPQTPRHCCFGVRGRAASRCSSWGLRGRPGPGRLKYIHLRQLTKAHALSH